MIWLIIIGIFMLIGVMLFNNQEFKDWLTMKLNEGYTFKKDLKKKWVLKKTIKLKKQFDGGPQTGLVNIIGSLIGVTTVLVVGVYVLNVVGKEAVSQINNTSVNLTGTIHRASGFMSTGLFFIVLAISMYAIYRAYSQIRD